MKENNHSRILTALKKLPNKEGNADAIAAYCNLDKTEVTRRLSEMIAKELIIDTGRKSLTVKGCKASIYRVKENKSQQSQTSLF
jgi:predicted transcriptional regulator